MMNRQSFTRREGVPHSSDQPYSGTAATTNRREGRSVTPAPAFRLGHRPSLDGLRGVAILCVLVCHLSQLGGSFGFVGVDIFFVLSGFLITCLLLEEWNRTNRISLKAFYARRALRLLPALLFLLVAYLGYGALVHSHKGFLLDVKHAVTTLFYSMNWATTFYTENIVFLRHAWSLSIEEQFYLLWPALLLFLLLRVSRNSILSYALLGCFVSWLTRCFLFLGTASDANRLYVGLDTRADALLLGCSIAVLLSFGQVPRSRGLTIALRHGSALSAAGLVCFGFAFQMYSPFMYLLGWFLITVFSGVILLEIMTAPVSPVRQALENPVLRYFGEISYGLYLWHWPVLAAVKELAPAWPFWQAALVSGVLSFAVTLLSYYFVEQPCLRLKKRFQKVNAAETSGPVPQPSAAVRGAFGVRFQSPFDSPSFGSE